MSTHHSTPYADISVDPNRTVLLVDDWNDIQRRFDIRPDCILGFEADWSATGAYEATQRRYYWLRIRTTFGTADMLTPHDDHSAEWFADILDSLCDLLTPKVTP
jgi:hypothetical protein